MARQRMRGCRRNGFALRMALPSYLYSMQGDVEIFRVEKTAFRADNVETPSTPVLTGLVILLAQLGNGFSCFRLGHLKVRDLDPDVIKNRLAAVHKMEEAAHLNLSGGEWR